MLKNIKYMQISPLGKVYAFIHLIQGAKLMYDNEVNLNPIEDHQFDSRTDSALFSFDKNKGLEIVLSNKKVFESKLNEAKRHRKDKNYEMASRWAFEAGRFAILNHPGCFTSPELEELLLECGSHLPGVRIALKIPESTVKRRVFHIMSEGYQVGGHTRVVRNWIEKDKDSIHYLINTWQIKSTPKWLIDAVGKSGGICIPLETVSKSFLARAAALREIVQQYADVVVCHIHMYDPIPIMALTFFGGPSVIFLNHADHLFWMGSSIADIVFDLRPEAQKLSLKRRNIKNSYILPLPLNTSQNTISKELARKELGLPEEALVLLSIANGAKYDSFSRYHFVDLLIKILQKNCNATAIIVGPPDEGIWHQAYIDSNGRIKAVGTQNEIEKYYCCADIYLDSYPFCSVTSALDAGLRGLPAAALKNYNNELLSFDDVSMDGLGIKFTEIDAYIDYIGRLMNDKDFRNEEGNILLSNIKMHHVDLWKNYLDKGYELIKNTRHFVRLPDLNDKFEIEDLCLALFLKQNRK